MKNNLDTFIVPELPEFDFVQKEENGAPWKDNKWYTAPFDGLVYVQASGNSKYASAELRALISSNGQRSQRAQLHVTSKYMKGLGGEYWGNAMDTMSFPILKGEQFMVYKNHFTPKPDWITLEIQVIQYSTIRN